MSDAPVAAEPGAPTQEDDRRLRLPPGRAPQTMVAAVLAWATTLGPSLLSRSTPGLAKSTAVLALLAGLGGPAVTYTKLRQADPIARHVGITLFFLLAALTWVLDEASVHPARLDPLRAAIGGVAWGVYALSWRDSWVAEAQQADPAAAPLEARAKLPALAAPLTAAALFGSLTLFLLAWNVRDVERALAAHAAALACGIGVVSSAAAVAVGRGKHRAGRRSGTRTLRWALLLAFFLGAGVFWLLAASR